MVILKYRNQPHSTYIEKTASF